jgi:hypothetical protein
MCQYYSSIGWLLLALFKSFMGVDSFQFWTKRSEKDSARQMSSERFFFSVKGETCKLTHLPNWWLCMRSWEETAAPVLWLSKEGQEIGNVPIQSSDIQIAVINLWTCCCVRRWNCICLSHWWFTVLLDILINVHTAAIYTNTLAVTIFESTSSWEQETLCLSDRSFIWCPLASVVSLSWYYFDHALLYYLFLYADSTDVKIEIRFKKFIISYEFQGKQTGSHL